MKSSDVAKAAKTIRLAPKGVSVRAMKAVYTAIGLHLPNPQPSQQTLADITGYDVRVVKRAIAALEDQGFLSHQRVGKRESNAYVMGLPEVPSGDGTFSTSDGTFCGGEGTPGSPPKGSLEGKQEAAAEAAAANLSWEGEGKSQLAAALGLHPGSLHALLAAIRSDAYLADLEHDPARLVEVWGRKALRSARAAAEADTARREEEARRRQPRPKPEPPAPRTTKRFRSIVAPPPPAEAADPEPDTTTPADPDTTRDRHPSQFGLQAVAV